MTTQPDSPNSSYKADDSATCDKCGKFGAVQVNDQWLCEDCYVLCGSCCPEFEKETPVQTDGRSRES